MSPATPTLPTCIRSNIPDVSPPALALDLRLAAAVMLAEMRRPYRDSESRRLPRPPRMKRSPCVRSSPAQRDLTIFTDSW
ncbi:hypothetical protein DFH09DRAFT_1324346 [Mycena vulgaris]|nr:hypothetical protein DFH09DRAFT_1324346 [Mycena vulgaris]